MARAFPLPVRSPFHLETTVRLLQRRPANPLDVWDGRRYRRVLRAGDALVLCTVENQGTVDAPRLTLRLWPISRGRAEAERTLRRMLGLGLDPSFALPSLRAPPLRAIGRALRGARPPRFPTLFEVFGRIIPYQQLSLEAGSAITGRFVRRFGRSLRTPEGTFWSFPRPERIAEATANRLEGVGLNRAKVVALRTLASLVANGSLSSEEIGRLPTEEALRRLRDLPGVGPWTAALVLLRGLGRMDVFPGGDAGVLRGLRRVLGGSVPIAEIAERAGARRGYVYFYSLGARLLGEELIHPAP
ncbi:MAG: DNA-3-methyladenine glycosylase family protein [Myxococcales bacterium]